MNGGFWQSSRKMGRSGFHGSTRKELTDKLKKELPQQAAKHRSGDKDEEKKAAEDRLHGGRADNEPDSKFPPKELKKGEGHEKEHTDNPEIAKEIAKDHLKEDKTYYDKLDRIEK